MDDIQALRQKAVEAYGWGDEEVAAHLNKVANKAEEWPKWAKNFWRKSGEYQQFVDGQVVVSGGQEVFV